MVAILPYMDQKLKKTVEAGAGLKQKISMISLGNGEFSVF